MQVGRIPVLYVFSVILSTGAGFGEVDGGREFEEWESVDGRVLEARILFVDDGEVRMERADGMEFSIPIERFSEDDREKILTWEPPEIDVPLPDDAVLVFETDSGRGSGFLVQEGGRTWVYSNQHVIGDGLGVRAYDTSGRELDLGSLEIAGDRDLARFGVRADRGLILARRVGTGDEISVYGNSQGTGVITRSDGRVLGIAPKVMEVSSGIVSGNSGGPVVNSEGEVVGISSFVTFGEDDDPTVKNTRFEEPRRFALRLDGLIDFRPVGREEFQEIYREFETYIRVFDESIAFTEMVMKDPVNPILAGNFDSEEVIDLVEDHNKDVARIPNLASSGMPHKSKIRRISGRLTDTLEDSLETGEDSLQAALRILPDERFGWMESEVKRREQILEQWREAVLRVEESFD